MSKENIKLIKYLGIILIAAVMTYKLPHDTYSIIEYILKPITFPSSYINISGIVPLALIIFAVIRICKLERFKNRSRFIMVILVLWIIIPLLHGVIDLGRSGYYLVSGDGINSIDIKDSEVFAVNYDGDVKINVKLTLKDYGRNQEKFKVRVYLPKKLSDKIDKDFYELESVYVTENTVQTLGIDEQIPVSEKDSKEVETHFENYYWGNEIKYELYNDKESITMIDHGY